MGFYLYNEIDKSKTYVSSTYFRNQLLGFGTTTDNELDDIDFYESSIFSKLNFEPRVVQTEKLVEKILDNIDVSSSYLHYSVLSMDRTHILALAYLLYEGYINNEEFISVLKSNSSVTRSDMILEFLSREITHIDIFSSLEYYLKRINKLVTTKTIPDSYETKKILMKNPAPSNTSILQTSYMRRFKADYPYNGLPNWKRNIDFDVNFWLTLGELVVGVLAVGVVSATLFAISGGIIDPGLSSGVVAALFANEIAFQHGVGKDELTNDHITLDLRRVLTRYRSYGYAHYLKFIYNNRYKNDSKTLNKQLKEELYTIFTQILGEEIYKKVTSLEDPDNIHEVDYMTINDGINLDTILLLTNRSEFFNKNIQNEISPNDEILDYTINDGVSTGILITDCDEHIKRELSIILNLSEERLFPKNEHSNTDDTFSDSSLSSQVFSINSNDLNISTNHNVISSPNLSDRILQKELCDMTPYIIPKTVNNDKFNELSDLVNMNILSDISAVITDMIKVANKQGEVLSFDLDVNDASIDIVAWVKNRKEIITNYFFDQPENGTDVRKLNTNNILIKDKRHFTVRVLFVYEILIDYLSYIIDENRVDMNLRISDSFMKLYRITYLLRLSIYSEMNLGRDNVFELRGLDSFSSLSSDVQLVFSNLAVFDGIYKAITPQTHEYLDAAEKFYINNTFENYMNLLSKKELATDVELYKSLIGG